MARKKTKAEFGAFLRGLARTGNVRVAARDAGMDVGTAYDKRIKDGDFAGRWEKARAEGKMRAAAGKAKARARSGGGRELVLRNTKNGAQLVQAAEGRWCKRIEEAFFGHYKQTACIRWSARAAGISARTIHYRCAHYPDFAAQCAAIDAQATARLQSLLTEAGVASFDPDLAEEDLPKVTVAEAIAICRLKGGAGGGRRGRNIPPEPGIEEVRDEIVGRIAAIKRHREKGGDDG